MSQWYQGGYFTPTLQICRLATSPEPFGFGFRDGRHITKVDRIPKISAYTAPLSTTSSRSNKTTSSHEEKVPSHEEASRGARGFFRRGQNCF
ncbi:AIF_collapsed_G0053120.mRNA.1.CDS.1 [Saccharomyces cerevisiae]|nr:AIF_collapsed_G0053120.mRNA.1.CDS.1 [Saccharomyces cerevisiae]